MTKHDIIITYISCYKTLHNIHNMNGITQQYDLLYSLKQQCNACMLLYIYRHELYIRMLHTYIHTYIHIYIYIYIYIYSHTYIIRMCVYIYIYAHISIHNNARTYIASLSVCL